MKALYDSIRQLVMQHKPQVVAMRRHLHAHPELSGKEKETSDYIVKILEEQNISFQNNFGGHGIIAFIKGCNPEKSSVALRADMDALNINEATGLPFASQNPGIMHACGHDFHIANLLGVALVLNQLKSKFEGTAMLIFQPSEEKIPSGAELMLSSGIFHHNRPNAIFALHVDPAIPTGKIGTRCGPFLAASDELFITIHGKGGHGAYPHKCIDPIIIAAQTIMSIQTIISRNINPLHPTVINIGKIEGLGNTNIIPDEVFMCGTIRTFDNRWRETIHQRLITLIHDTAQAFGGSATVNIKKGYPPLVNNPSLTQANINILKEILGNENIIENSMKMGSEDFAFFAQEIPATYLRLGVFNGEKSTGESLHSATFSPDEAAFESGMMALSYLAICNLNKS